MSRQTQLNDERLARVAVEMRAMRTAADRDGRGYTSEQQEKFDRMATDYTAIEGRIQNSASVTAFDREEYTDTTNLRAEIQAVNLRRHATKESFRKHGEVFSKYLRDGDMKLESKEKRLLARHRAQDAPPGVAVPLAEAAPRRIRAAQTLTTTGGGYLIPQGFSDMLEEALQLHSGILGVTGSFETATGAPLYYPTANDVANEGRILSTNTQATETDLVFGQIEYGSTPVFSSDYVLVPDALIEDSYFDLDEYLAALLGRRLGRLVNKYLTIGTGSGQPTGIQTAVIASGLTVQGTTGETTSLIYNDLVDLMELVDPAYADLPTAGFMFADSTRKAVRLLKDTAGRPIWQAGLTAESGQKFPETILDKPYWINNDLPAMAASAYTILFGDMSRYKVRRVASGTTVLRSTERWGDYLQVGFQAYLRADGQLVDAGTHPIAAFQNSAS